MDQINFKCEKEMKFYLLSMENYSLYIRNLIDTDRIKLGNPEFIKSKIIEHETIIKQFKEDLKGPKLDNTKIKEILDYHAPKYQTEAPHRYQTQNFRYIEKIILPALKKAGYDEGPAEIDEILLNYPLEGK